MYKNEVIKYSDFGFAPFIPFQEFEGINFHNIQHTHTYTYSQSLRNIQMGLSMKNFSLFSLFIYIQISLLNLHAIVTIRVRINIYTTMEIFPSNWKYFYILFCTNPSTQSPALPPDGKQNDIDFGASSHLLISEIYPSVRMLLANSIYVTSCVFISI